MATIPPPEKIAPLVDRIVDEFVVHVSGQSRALVVALCPDRTRPELERALEETRRLAAEVLFEGLRRRERKDTGGIGPS